jgi:hypothetical protein
MAQLGGKSKSKKKNKAAAKAKEAENSAVESQDQSAVKHDGEAEEPLEPSVGQ